MIHMQNYVFLMLLNVKVFNLMLRTNERRNIKRWNDNKCKFECKELIDKEIRDIEFCMETLCFQL